MLYGRKSRIHILRLRYFCACDGICAKAPQSMQHAADGKEYAAYHSIGEKHAPGNGGDGKDAGSGQCNFLSRPVMYRGIYFSFCIISSRFHNRYSVHLACLHLSVYRRFINYIASATTSSTSGTMRFSNPSIPAFKVIMEEGQPLQEPCSISVTFPS